ncbi:MAG: YkoP family protein [Bradyrhizobium sp.]
MLNALVSAIDSRLRARQGIFEYSTCPRCIFRVELAANARSIALADGTTVSAGGRLVNLHFWNEHVPRLPARGPTVSWARRMRCDIEMSLQELATFLASRPALADVTAIEGNMAFGSSEQTQLVANLAARYGFVRPAESARRYSVLEALHLVGENILISMILMSHNPAAFRADCFRRSRVKVYLHRAELMRRFGKRMSDAGQQHQ